MAALRDLFDGEIGGVIQSGRASGLNEHQVAEDLVAGGGEILHQPGAIVETNQKNIIILVRGVDKAAQSAERPVDSLFHGSGNVVNDSTRDRRVFVGEVHDLLFDLIVKEIEVVLAQPGDEAPIKV